MTKPSDTLKFKYINPDDPSGALTETTLFMSMNMLQCISFVVGNLNQVGAASFNPLIQRSVMAELLAPRDNYGDRNDDGFRPPNSTIDEASKVMNWVRDHLLTFFSIRWWE